MGTSHSVHETERRAVWPEVSGGEKAVRNKAGEVDKDCTGPMARS